ncbi:competence/damage-inducible protein A [Flavobacteriaceae bacterium]|nr:competence/damage-inducible protein A [Flavobacteriaceae bacterium]MDB2632304.1 competence/damage-inducible protein A [Flavobacteriaceae bacterium]
MNAEIITIGDEILIGQIVDTNSAYIAKELNKIGISVFQITSVQDDKKHILEALENAQNHAGLVILTGGLGPTKDDITKTTLADYFEDTLVRNKEVVAHIKHIWKTYIKQPLLQVNLDQALVPSKAKVLMNQSGSAPGMWMENNTTVFISLPGVPFEMKALMQNEVLPRLSKQFELPFILHKTVLTYGLGESVIADRISEWENNLPKSVKLAYLPNLGRVRLRLSSKGYDKAAVYESIHNEIEKLLPQISDVFVGFEEESSIEQIIGNQLIKSNTTLAVAESCTGGRIGAQFTANPGASAYFKGGVIAYDTTIKTQVLGVDKPLIETHSVVSTEVAEAMALGVQKLYNSDYAIATTGNAGPSKGDSDAEVGTVCIAIATPHRVFSKQFTFGKHRERITTKALHMALTLLQKEIF